MMASKYDLEDLTEVYMSLSDEQKLVIDTHIKRGKKTEWLNIWAKKKGGVLSEEDLSSPDKAMESLLEWILIEYEDFLTVNSEIRCECGRPLRYRYTVLHKPTGKEYKLGIIHLQQHTGLSPEIVRLITKGLKKIDLERDEILTKIKDNWKLAFDIPTDFEIPKDMQEQLRVNLPLLDRQVERLKSSIAVHIGERKKLLERESILNIDLVSLYNKLKSYTITSKEAEQLFKYIQNCPNELVKRGLAIDEIKRASTKALGYIGDRNIRYWLVEIEDL
jgi:hypothetical protein